MPNVRVSYEAKRGCGYRKPGGLYMVSGKPNAPCGKLPLELHVCPTCSQGIKPSRSWTWIKPQPLFAAQSCAYEGLTVLKQPVSVSCGLCICGGLVPERAGLIWVGGKYYKTADDFMREAHEMGVSRRIPAVPKDFEVGKTVVYLAHRQAISETQDCPDCQSDGEVDPNCELCEGTGRETTYKPAIFSAFIPTAVEYIVKQEDTEEKLERLEKRGIELVDVKRIQQELPLGGAA